MAQQELDPSDKNTTGTVPLTRPSPISTRKFGRFPNVEDWLPGDIILLRMSSPNWVADFISRAQQQTYAAEHARWTHIAVYIGDGHICEAIPFRGVVYHRIDHYVGTRILRVRRPLNLDDRQRFRLCIETLVQLKKRYSFIKAASVVAYLKPYFRLSSIHRTAPVVCSQLYAIAYVLATKRVLLEESLVTPAHLSASTELEDVPVCWRSIA